MTDLIVKENIRLRPALTAKQIEAEGWNMIFTTHLSKRIGEYTACVTFRENDIIDIMKIKDVRNDKCIPLFYGQCPTIYDFRYICKLLNI